MIKKIITLKIICAALLFTGCAWYKSHISPQTQAVLLADGAQIAQNVLHVAGQTVDAVAQGETDAQIKNQFLQSAGDFFRSLEGTSVSLTETEIAARLKKWLPDASHWSEFAGSIAKLVADYAAHYSKTPQFVDQILEIVANTLNTKQPNPPSSP